MGDESEGPYVWWRASGWINGYISEYNGWVDNGKSDIVAGMGTNDTYRWLASWCRDNPSKGLFDAIQSLILSRN